MSRPFIGPVCTNTVAVAPGEYELKRLLKYEVGAEERDQLLADIFTADGGDELALAAAVYLGPDECRALHAAGIELGAHTVNHLILSSLDEKRQRQEIEGSLRDLQSWVGGEGWGRCGPAWP